MTPAEAKRILIDLTVFDEPWEAAQQELNKCILEDGRFDTGLHGFWLSADQLEALAVWMRDPEGVSQA